jgi:hypothetical protein
MKASPCGVKSSSVMRGVVPVQAYCIEAKIWLSLNICNAFDIQLTRNLESLAFPSFAFAFAA